MVDWYARDMALRKEHIKFYMSELRKYIGEEELLSRIKGEFGELPKDSRELHNFLANLYEQKKEK